MSAKKSKAKKKGPAVPKKAAVAPEPKEKKKATLSPLEQAEKAAALATKAAEKATEAANNAAEALAKASSARSTISTTEIGEPTRQGITLGPETKYVRSVKSGAVFIEDAKNKEHEDLRPCSAPKKDGTGGQFLSKRDAALDESDLTIEGKISMIGERKAMISFGARYEVTFVQGMKLEDMKAGMLESVRKGEVEGINLKTIVG